MNEEYNLLCDYSKAKVDDGFSLITGIISGMSVLEIEAILSKIKELLKAQSIYSYSNRPNIGTKEEYFRKLQKEGVTLNLIYVQHRNKS